MRLDIPPPLGARIFLTDDCPSFWKSHNSFFSTSSSVFFCWWVEAQEEETGRPTVEKWRGSTEDGEAESGETEIKNKREKGIFIHSVTVIDNVIN